MSSDHIRSSTSHWTTVHFPQRLNLIRDQYPQKDPRHCILRLLVPGSTLGPCHPSHPLTFFESQRPPHRPYLTRPPLHSLPLYLVRCSDRHVPPTRTRTVEPLSPTFPTRNPLTVCRPTSFRPSDTFLTSDSLRPLLSLFQPNIVHFTRFRSSSPDFVPHYVTLICRGTEKCRTLGYVPREE